MKAAAGNSASEYGNVIKPEVRDFFSYGEDDISGRTLIVLNPPYGRRIGSGDPLSLYVITSYSIHYTKLYEFPEP